MVGAPGAGKSTKARELAKQYNAHVIDGDAIKERLGIARGASNWTALHDEIVNEIEEHMGMPVILDGTHYNSQVRQEALYTLNGYGFEPITMAYVHATLEECLSRNASRSRQVPEFAICEMHMRIEKERATFQDEGFDSVLWL
jgi:predicted kinase